MTEKNLFKNHSKLQTIIQSHYKMTPTPFIKYQITVNIAALRCHHIANAIHMCYNEIVYDVNYK